MDRITLSGMRLETRLGVDEDERALPQLVEVDVAIEADLSPAAATDSLADTIDYGPVVAATRETVEGGEHRLLEGLAGAVSRRVLEGSPSIVAVTVRVRKLAVPTDVDIDHAEVELRRERGRSTPG